MVEAGDAAAGRRSQALPRAALMSAACLGAGKGGWLLVREPLRAPARCVAAHDWHALAALRFSDVLAGVMAAVLLACGVWLLVATLLSVAAETLRTCLPPRGVHASTGAGWQVLVGLAEALDRCSPRVIRRLVSAALGIVVAAGAAPALAADTGSGLAAGTAPARPAGGPTTRLDGLAVPDRVTGTGTVTASPATVGVRPRRAAGRPGGAGGLDRARAHRPVVAVSPGDSLWSIASDLLPAGAPDARVDRAWRLLYRANRPIVGSDPNLIEPGDRLVIPDLDGLTAGTDRTQRTGLTETDRKDPQ